MDELGRLGLRWVGGDRRGAQGALADSQRGSGGGVSREVGRTSDAAGTQLARSRILPAQIGRLDHLETCVFEEREKFIQVSV